MTLPSMFVSRVLENRLGQQIDLAVYHCQVSGREYVFIAVLAQQASSLVAKNAETFAFQLRELFKLDARRFELVELRGGVTHPEFWRWRFEWVGNSPLAPRCEFVASLAQQNQFMSVLNVQNVLQTALA